MYRQVEHTADLALEAEAGSREELFAEVLRGMTDCMTDPRQLRRDRRRKLEVSAPELDLLLVEWLNEALYRFEVHRELYRQAAVEIRSEGSLFQLVAQVEGERWDPRRHRLRVAIKGVTYHGLRVEERGGLWYARVVLDI